MSAYHPSFPSFHAQVDGLREVLSANNVDLDVEFMDSKRFFTPENLGNFTRLLQYKLENLPPYDVLVVADDNALDYAVENRDTLFKGLPVVFLGINNAQKAMRLHRTLGMTGVIEQVSMEQTVELMRLLLPDTRNVVVLTDATPSGQEDLKRFKEIMRLRGDERYSVFDLSTMRWEDASTMLHRLSSRDAILLLSCYRDQDGKTVDFEEGLGVVTGSANLPVFHLWEHGIGKGIVGGKVISFTEHGRLAGELVLNILAGGKPKDLPVVTGGKANVLLFDKLALERFHIPTSLLPQGSVLLNSDPTFWEANRVLLIEVGVLVLMLVLVGACLYRINRAKVRVNEQLVENEKQYRAYMENAPDGVLVFDPEGVILQANAAMSEMVGYGEDRLAGESIFNLLPAAVHERARADLSSLLRTSAHTGGYELLRQDGKYAYVRFNGVLLDNGNILGFCQDVTEIKRKSDAQKESEMLFRSLLEQAGDSVFVCDMEGHFLFVNDAACLTLGYTRTELLELKTWEVDQALADSSRRMGFWSQNAVITESTHRRKDGTTIPTELKTARLKVGGKDVLLVISRDISKRREKERRERSKQVINQAQAEIIKSLSSHSATVRSIAKQVYDWALRLTGSRYCYVGMIDPRSHDLQILAISVMQEGLCRLESDNMAFKQEDGIYPALWGESLNTGKGFYSNMPANHPMAKGVPEGHVKLTRLLSVPCVYEAGVVGQVAVANADQDYNDEDLETLETLANLFALAIYQIRMERELIQARRQGRDKD
ncbi:ABC transporter substrate binding protein [Pseudodesulfovibrio cashew]|uniref:ABC transporter substrate binding protein n=1 Tax=Pseudodesulfovibrio cashew TaxID=2678688 RepID=UPI00131DC806|nr:ABC transporter substrate binding protein [Pseudodesulfovibrio cashew]